MGQGGRSAAAACWRRAGVGSGGARSDGGGKRVSMFLRNSVRKLCRLCIISLLFVFSMCVDMSSFGKHSLLAVLVTGAVTSGLSGVSVSLLFLRCASAMWSSSSFRFWWKSLPHPSSGQRYVFTWRSKRTERLISRRILSKLLYGIIHCNSRVKCARSYIRCVNNHLQSIENCIAKTYLCKNWFAQL